MSSFFGEKALLRTASIVALIRFRDRVNRRRASVSIPMRARLGMEPAGFVESVDENRGRHAVATQRLQREVRRHIPTRLGSASAVSKVSVWSQQRHVYVGMVSGGAAQFSGRWYAVAPASIIREHLGASRLRSLRSPLARP